MTSTLSERYIAAAVNNIPPASRGDVQAELNVSITDAIDARISQGESQLDAERAVLNDLGDPGMLAAGYTDRTLHLIGPRYFLTWWRLLKLLLIIVPVTAMGGVALAQALSEAPITAMITAIITTGLTAVMQTAFWVTLVFAVMERSTGSAAIAHWSVDSLPEIPVHGAGRSDMISSVIFLVIGIGIIAWDQLRGLVVQGGEVYPFLNPALWPWWLTGLLVLMASKVALVIAVYRTKRWTASFAIINTAFAVAFAFGALLLLATGQLVNPQFVSEVFIENGVSADTLRTLAIVAGAAFVGLSAWDIIDAWHKAFRDNRR